MVNHTSSCSLARCEHAKSIVRVRFTATQLLNSWQQYAPIEYGFYANVKPTVDRPPWKTLMFNGYADQVQSRYACMDLRKNY